MTRKELVEKMAYKYLDKLPSNTAARMLRVILSAIRDGEIKEC